MAGPDIFDYLAKQTVAKTTQANLHDSVKNTNVDRTNIRAWQDAIMIAKAMEESRTYSHGLPVPEAGVAYSVSVGAGSSVTIAPEGSEIWLLQAWDNLNFTMVFTDGSTEVPVGVTNVNGSNPIYLTNSLYLKATNSELSSQDFKIAYHKVSL